MKIPARRNYHTQLLYYFILNNRLIQNELCTHLHWPWWWRWRFSCVTSSADRRRWTRPRGKGRCWRRWRTKAPPGSLAASCPRSPSSLTQRTAGRPMGPFPLACKPLRSSYCTASGLAHLGLCRRSIRKEMSEKWLQIFTVGEPNFILKTTDRPFVFFCTPSYMPVFPIVLKVSKNNMIFLYLVQFCKKKTVLTVRLFGSKHCILMASLNKKY